jgi:hypothetical protein
MFPESYLPWITQCLLGDPTRQMAPFAENVAWLYYKQMELDTHTNNTQKHKIAMTRLLFENKWLAKKVRGEEEKTEVKLQNPKNPKP